MITIDEIINEVAFRCDTGIPDLKNVDHIYILSEVLTEMGYGFIKDEIIGKIIQLTESPDDDKKTEPTNPDDEKYVHIGGSAYVKKNDYDETRQSAKDGAQHYTKNDTGKYVPMSDDAYEDEKSAQGDLGSDNGQKSPEGGFDEVDQEVEHQKTVARTFNDTTYQKKIDTEENAAIEADRRKSSGVVNPNRTIEITTESEKPHKGSVTDVNDEYSDGKIKQDALNYGTTNKIEFKPAPGNAGSMFAEIMSGESYFHMDNDPMLTNEQLADRLYEQTKDTTIGKEIGDYNKTSNKTGKYAGKNKTLMMLCESTAASGKRKWERSKRGTQLLVNEEKLTEPVQARNFYGHIDSIDAQLKLVNAIDGNFYTHDGVKVDKDELISLIEQSGGGENPSDTSTITVDVDGNAMVEFHSDKISTSDIQGNSTMKKESEQAIQTVTEIEHISGQDKASAIHIISDGQKQLEFKEAQLKTVATDVATKLSERNMSSVLRRIRKSELGEPFTTSMETSLKGAGNPHSYLRDYLPPDSKGTRPELLKAFFDAYSDPENPRQPTASQIKFMGYLSTEYKIDVSKKLSEIRQESIQIQRDTHAKLNERSVTLESGETKKLGDYIEAKNIIEKLHLDVIDGEKGHGVGKYGGLFNVNMGGVIVESAQLKHCIGVDDTEDFITHFDVGKPEAGDEFTRNTQTGAITGRNVFVSAVTKKGKRIPFAFKTQRSKQGPTGKLDVTYQWALGTQNCFKKNQ